MLYRAESHWNDCSELKQKYCFANCVWFAVTINVIKNNKIMATIIINIIKVTPNGLGGIHLVIIILIIKQKYRNIVLYNTDGNSEGEQINVVMQIIFRACGAHSDWKCSI